MRKHKNQIRTIVEMPKHRVFPIGLKLSVKSSYNILFKSRSYGEISDSVLKAFKKTLYSKRLRKLFVFRAAPYQELTKKPDEVRMGKGHGIKIRKRIFPYRPGQVLAEIRLKKKSRAKNFAIFSLKKAAKKLPFHGRILSTDI